MKLVFNKNRHGSWYVANVGHQHKDTSYNPLFAALHGIAYLSFYTESFRVVRLRHRQQRWLNWLQRNNTIQRKTRTPLSKLHHKGGCWFDEPWDRDKGMPARSTKKKKIRGVGW